MKEWNISSIISREESYTDDNHFTRLALPNQSLLFDLEQVRAFAEEQLCTSPEASAKNH